MLGVAGCGGTESETGVKKSYGPPARSEGWNLKDAAEPYKGTQIKAVFLDRPGYAAAIKLIPEFERQTGIKVTWETMPYENSRERQVLDFTGGTSTYDVVLIDVVWVGEFATSGWVVPLGEFYTDPELADPKLNLEGFFPVLLDSFGTWGKLIYGLPFDNYSGLLFYNRRMLEDAGFDGPPESWEQLYEEYGPKLTKGDQYAFALQSRRGETQSADSFMRMVWQAGGELLDPETFRPRLNSRPSLDGLNFRQKLMKYMPPDIVEWDHDEAVQGLAQGNVAMITEWSANYATLADPKTSKISDYLGVGLEPNGAGDKPHPALGGFSLGVSASSSEEKQKASWLFIQWVTSEAKAKDYIRAGGVSGRKSAYEDPELRRRYPFFDPLVESWNKYGNPIFRPRFPEWPEISEVISENGTEMMLGRMSANGGVEKIESRMNDILSPYIKGDEPKLQ